jgi:hypothetical protein
MRDYNFGGGSDGAYVGQFVLLAIAFAEFIAMERRGDRNAEGVGWLRRCGDGQVVGLDGGFEGLTPAWLMDVETAAVKGLDDIRVDVNTNDLKAVRGQSGDCGQADVAQPEDTNFSEVRFYSTRCWGEFISRNDVYVTQEKEFQRRVQEVVDFNQKIIPPSSVR